MLERLPLWNHQFLSEVINIHSTFDTECTLGGTDGHHSPHHTGLKQHQRVWFSSVQHLNQQRTLATMPRNNNNQGNNPIWTDNSDQTFNALLASVPSQKNNHSTKTGKRGHNVKWLLAKIFTNIAQASLDIAHKLEG